MGEGSRAFFFAFLRKIILLIPLIYLLPALLPWGVLAVVLAEPVSDILTTAVNALYFRRFLNKKVPDNCVAGGVPAKVPGEIRDNMEESEDEC